MIVKATLEKKLGEISDEAFNFAVEQFERNVSIGRIEKKISTAEALDEISFSVDFYYRNIAIFNA